MNILVTGAAGYIGSVITERLLESGHGVIALDNLQQGHRQALDHGARFVKADLGDRAALDEILKTDRIDAVMHMAASSLVGESMTNPGKYFNNNIVNSLNLLNTMVAHGVTRLVFSSSAAVYGIPERVPITEAAPAVPVNPYGETKIAFENILKWYNTAHGIDSVSLRYFNAAGATATHGEHHDPETHLIPNVMKVVLGKAPQLSVFGNDYDTADGTCVRDYVHVVDIAEAHILALNNIDCSGARSYNLGSQSGYSVLEVVKAVEKVAGKAVPSAFEPRRPGDPPVLIASSELAGKELGWSPRFPGLDKIISDAWQWQTRYPDGYTN
jgi:UDP-glucose 4-epimerase